MEAIRLKKKDLLQISKINPNNDVFNQMIAELSKQKPQTFKLKKCNKTEQRQLFSLLKEKFITDLINDRLYKIQDQRILDSLAFYEFMEEKAEIIPIWYEFLQNNAAYFIFTNESLSMEYKLKYLDKLPVIYKETQDRVVEIKQRNITLPQWKPKKVKIQQQEQYDEILN